MESTADILAEKIQTLTPEQLADVERFVASLQSSEHHSDFSLASASISETSFAAVWNNPEDDIYDAL